MNSYDIASQHGMLVSGEIDVLKDAVKLLPENPVIVNIGAGYGTSAIAMLEQRPDAFIFSVDRIPRPEERASMEACKMPLSRVVRLLAVSWEAGEHFPFPIDMVFIDGAHYEEAVDKDMKTWIPHVKSGGVVAFHDYAHPNVPTLQPQVDAFMGDQERLGQFRYLITFRKA